MGSATGQSNRQGTPLSPHLQSSVSPMYQGQGSYRQNDTNYEEEEWELKFNLNMMVQFGNNKFIIIIDTIIRHYLFI